MSPRYIIKIFLYWRFFLFLPLIVAFFLVPYRSGYAFTNIFNINNPGLRQVIYSSANFDGVRYLSIALRGYITEAVFFPFYPLLIKLFSVWSDNTIILFWIGLLLSNICLVVGMIFLNRLLLLDYSKRVSSEAVLLMLIFPSAFFFGEVYSESLFFLLLIFSLYLARKGAWFRASLCAMLLTATRLVGIFILPALIYEYYLQKGIKIEWRKLLGFMFIPFGLISYMVFCFKKWGDVLYFIHAHEQLGNNRSVDKIVLFPQTMFRYLKIFITLPTSQYEWWISLLEISVFLVVCLLIYQAWRKRVRMSYQIFSLLAFFFPASSGTFIGMPRYVLVLFPVFIVIALTKSKFVKVSYIIIGMALQFVLLMFFSRGYFVA